MAELSEADATARAEAIVQQYCGWHIAPVKDDDVTLDGPGTGALLLPSLHVVAIAAITEDGVALDPDSYAWSTSGIVRRDSITFWSVWSQPRWTNGLRAVRVEFTHGYDEWPLDVQTVIDRLAERLLESSGVLTQVGSVSYATDSSGAPLGGTPGDAEKAILAGYKLPPRP